VDELRKRELTIDDLFTLVGASQFFKDRGFNVAEMFMTFSSYKKMEGEIVNQQKLLAALNKRILEVEQESKFEEELLAEKRLKNSELDKLKEMGFGLGELTAIRNMANEMAIESCKSTERGEAVREFISDIENHLHDYLRIAE
jgi:hypothetical protein